MRQFILGLILLFSVNGMAKFHHVHHFHHHSHPNHYNHVTTHTRNKHPHKTHPITRRHDTKVINTFWRNGILYYIILNPGKGRVYNNGLVLCEGCNKVLVKKEVRYCSRCRRIRGMRLR